MDVVGDACVWRVVVLLVVAVVVVLVVVVVVVVVVEGMLSRLGVEPGGGVGGGALAGEGGSRL